MRVRELTEADLDDISGWAYEGAWAVYDSGGGRLDPGTGYWAVVEGSGDDEQDEQLVGFACLGEDARVPGLAELPGVLDVGVGMRPGLVGQGRGREFATAVLDFAAARGARRLRAVVQEWNERGLRLLARLGFQRTGTYPVGDVTYVVLEKETR